MASEARPNARGSLDFADEAAEMTVYEDFVVEQVKGGVPIIGLYPCTRNEHAVRFKAWRAERGR